jgi:integrase-like protein
MAQQSHSSYVAQSPFSDLSRRRSAGKSPLIRLARLHVRAFQQMEFSMSRPASPLRQRMIDDMKLRNMSPTTQGAYVRAVKNLSSFFKRSPDQLTFEDMRVYQLHLVSRGLQPATIIPIMCAIRFFYGTTLGKPNVAEHIPLARKPKTLPAVLSQDEVIRLLKVVPDRRYRTHIHDDLCRGVARFRSGRPHDQGPRLHPDGDLCPPGQRAQRPFRHAVGAVANRLA